jgi:hypothetical protein
MGVMNLPDGYEYLPDVYAPDVLLLRRHTTPLFSASLRSVAVDTPPTPPVLHVAALGGSGPGCEGQLALEVHCAPVMLHLPTGGQLTGSTPGVVQARFVRAHTPAVAGHWLSLAHAAPLVLHLPALGQSAFFWHAVTASLQTPFPHAVAVEQEAPLLLQVPDVRHALLLVHAFPDLEPDWLLQVPMIAGQDADAVQLPKTHVFPAPVQSDCLVHCVAVLEHAPTEQAPPVNGHWPFVVQEVVPSLHVPLTVGHVAAVWHVANGALLQLPGQSEFTRQTAPPFLQLPLAGH